MLCRSVETGAKRPETAWNFFARQRGRLLLAAAGLLLAAAAVRMPLLGTGYAAPDTSAYLEVAENLFSDGFRDNLRPPAYAFLFAVLEGLGANPVNAATVLQNVVGTFLPVAVLLVGWRCFGFVTGLMAGFLAAASPLMIVTEQFALAENLFGVIVFVATVLLAAAVLRVREAELPWPLLVAVGALFGVATLFRANGMLALFAIPIILAIAARQWRPALRATAIALGAMLVVLAPWSIHNLVKFGDPNVSTVGNISLYAHTVTSAHVPPNPDSREGRLALEIYNAGAPPTAVFNALVGEGMTANEAAAAMGVLARDAIARYPDIYLSNTWSRFLEHEDLYDPRSFGPNQNHDEIAATRYYFEQAALTPSGDPLPEGASLPGDSPWTRALWQLGQALTRLLYLATFAGILMLLLPFFGPTRQRLVAMTFLVVVLLGFLGNSFTAVFSARYGIMFAPLVWILMAATTVRVAELAAMALQRGRMRLASQS